MTLCAECIMNRSSSLIAEARHAVREVFGADTECTLERFVDPEATDSEPFLFLLVSGEERCEHILGAADGCAGTP